MRWITIVLILGALPLAADRRGAMRERFERLLLIVPMTGTGAYDDPRRPLYVPAKPAPLKGGVLEMSYELSDDGKYALLELIAENREAFSSILSAGRADVKIFEPKKVRKQDVEIEIKKYIKNFDVEKLGRKGR